MWQKHRLNIICGLHLKNLKNYFKGEVILEVLFPNARATNEYKHKVSLSYCANIFMNPILKQFFRQKEM